MLPWLALAALAGQWQRAAAVGDLEPDYYARVWGIEGTADQIEDEQVRFLFTSAVVVYNGCCTAAGIVPELHPQQLTPSAPTHACKLSHVWSCYGAVTGCFQSAVAS